MVEFQLGELVQGLDARLLGAGDGRLAEAEVSISSVSTDSRSLQPGDLFVALQGPSFDGHDYLSVAAQRQAAAVMVSQTGNCFPAALPGLQVADTRLALGRLAGLWRQRAQATVVAITGSNGKTTVKEMLAAILAQDNSVLATQGNLNNDIGLPLTLTRLQDEAFAVVELGANHPGEIDYLSKIARPDVALLNNAGRAHLEGFGSLEGVAKAKLEIIRGLSKDGTFIFNADDAFADLWAQEASTYRQITFGVQQPATVSSAKEDLHIRWQQQGFSSEFEAITPRGLLQIKMQLVGEHNRLNALAAIAAAQVLGATDQAVVAGLGSLQSVAGRLCLQQGHRGARLVDDSYNANPDSVAMAIQVLASAPGRRSLVLGDLGELGVTQKALHAQIGETAKAAGIDQLFTCGTLSEAASQAFGTGARHFGEHDALIEFLLQQITEEDSMLVKGSRAAAMDKVVAKLLKEKAPC